MEKSELIRIFKELSAVQYGKFTLSSGGVSDVFIDAQKVMRDKAGRALVRKLGREKLSEIERQNNYRYEIAGVHSGGSMFAEIVAEGRAFLR